ncbi:MAG TPA: bifunctional serine/threonine-protein kinase/formylglycine-generating enzyme family protein, partial [Planctomycetota bacterium]|nr:bifunctional serine/threonine-protein kinase/formylglycine-generating enzyme family protein [Planctomycetota bacterium]
QQLPLRARIEMFLLVLDAMQHAHQKAVLHRDLSSNNVLIADPAGRAQPKIIDFGIAKSLSDPLLAGVAMTFQGTMMGTPEFMSPEQAAGRTNDIDTRCDVYALGVQLYELLCDQLPIPGVVLRAQGLAGMAKVILSHRPRPPSEVAPPERRATLRGDLDAIVMKAINKARDERYASVGDLATDLQHFLADEPVQVLMPTTWYRLRKFVRRHRAESVAIAIVSLGLVVALTVTWKALGVAEQALADVSEQKERLAAKADPAFRLLANEERLHDAVAAAAALPPPWPEHASAYAAWIAQHGEPLASELPKLDDRLQQLAEQKAHSPGQQFADPVDQHLARSLERLRDSLRAFVGTGGEYARVLEQQRFLERELVPAASQYAERWRAAIAAIMKSDGTTASAAYRGLQIKPLPGLVPLGCDPTTRLYEFLDLSSHGLGRALPERDASTGELHGDADTGIVLVLIPGGMLRMGARRGDPGMAQNDEHAANDELNGPFVRLDEFLLARTELTIGQWARLCGRAAAADADPLLPVTGIDWDEACATLGRFELRLPTEAQWEYACRAETTTPWSTGEDPAGVAKSGWFGATAERTGLLRPNAFGLFDLHGNVAEWCLDARLPYSTFAPRVGDGLHNQADLPAGAPRVVRGGACHQGPFAARSSARDARPPATRDSTIGLRAARMLRPMH